MLGLGIDTGGTYTDAAIYDFSAKKVLASAKSLTTKEELSSGILASLDKLPRELLTQVKTCALSTTLATNACVENKGGRARLVFIGVDRGVVEKVGKSYGLPPVEEMYFLGYEGLFSGEIVTPPDWELFEREIGGFLSDADSVGVVDLFAMKNSAVLEKRARGIIQEIFDKPIICGHDLFDDLNSVKRGASTLLNARLIPVIREFIAAIKVSLSMRGVDVPIVLVRSDGSLMSEEFTAIRPVETLLCGPCASVIGGIELSGETDCMIVDMGGTTTDIAIVRGGIPLKSTDGINIGDWRTYVKGIYVDTFGLGGDSGVRCDKNFALQLDSSRIIPISHIAAAYPETTAALEDLLSSGVRHTYPLNEFLCLVKDIADSPNYTEEEKRLCAALKARPLIYKEAAAAMRTDIYKLKFDRLEREGVIIRAGLTPTDVMCIKGDFTGYDPTAAKLTAGYISDCAGIETEEELCNWVYEEIKKKLYVNLLRILWEQRYPDEAKEGIHPSLLKLFADSWEGTGSAFDLGIKTSLSLVGIGAPIHIFLSAVAEKLNTRCIIPDCAGVANAVGAVMGNVVVSVDIEVKPASGTSDEDTYTVYGKRESIIIEGYHPAIEAARLEAEQYAYEEAQRRGASGEIKITSEVVENRAELRDGSMYLLNTYVNAKAVSSI